MSAQEQLGLTVLERTRDAIAVLRDGDVVLESVRRRYAGECVLCGCGEYSACEGALGNCHWVAPNLCSGCAA